MVQVTDEINVSRADQEGNVALATDFEGGAYVVVFDAAGGFVRDVYFNFACSPSLMIENEPAYGVVMEAS